MLLIRCILTEESTGRMGSLSAWNDLQGASPQRPKRARIGGLIFALAVVLGAIWVLSRVQ